MGGALSAPCHQTIKILDPIRLRVKQKFYGWWVVVVGDIVIIVSSSMGPDARVDL